MSDILTVATKAAREAGAFLHRNHGGAMTVETKEDNSLVTNVDREAERMIVERILAAFPGHDIVAEETGRTSRGSDHCWIVDPLDGTHNYIRGIGAYGVSIGVQKAGEFVAGVLFMPETDELYVAERGSGAFRNDTRIHVSQRSTLSSCAMSFDSELRLETERKLRVLGELCPRIFNIRLIGSSARNLSHIAEGSLDGVIEFSDKVWDFAAGAVIVTEAGGRITSFAGAGLGLSDTAYVASNGLIHDSLLKIIESTERGA
ncbi:MAG TPA: inositol monophosphatase [Spirochaetia bacterium]|nr:inositol monophosphatase [Spirochaetia bacterium]